MPLPIPIRTAAWLGILCCPGRSRKSHSRTTAKTYDPRSEEADQEERYFGPNDITFPPNRNGPIPDRRRPLDEYPHSYNPTVQRQVWPLTGESFPQDIFIYDVKLLRAGAKNIYRRLVLSFDTDDNIISDDICHCLGTPMAHYYGNEIRLPGSRAVKPIGKVNIKWQLDGGRKAYTTDFFVVRDKHFDMALGSSSIEEHELYKEDLRIGARMSR